MSEFKVNFCPVCGGNNVKDMTKELMKDMDLGSLTYFQCLECFGEGSIDILQRFLEEAGCTKDAIELN